MECKEMEERSSQECSIANAFWPYDSRTIWQRGPRSSDLAGVQVPWDRDTVNTSGKRSHIGTSRSATELKRRWKARRERERERKSDRPLRLPERQHSRARGPGPALIKRSRLERHKSFPRSFSFCRGNFSQNEEDSKATESENVSKRQPEEEIYGARFDHCLVHVIC